MILTDGVTTGSTVITSVLLVADAGDAQVRLLVMITLTWLPVKSVFEVKVFALVPAFDPFTSHWYTGVVPPLTGVAVNVTEVPEHTVVAPVLIVTEGVNTGTTVSAIVLLVAVGVSRHVSLLVMTTFTCSVPFRVFVVNVLLLLPAFMPSTFHW